jgi:hypothetical protein
MTNAREAEFAESYWKEMIAVTRLYNDENDMQPPPPTPGASMYEEEEEEVDEIELDI